MPDTSGRRDRFRGMLLGTAAGDALGLPMEGLSRRRAARLFPGPLRHRLIFGRGMVSDDTDHAVMTTQSLLAAPDDPDAFARTLAWRLRFWVLSLPAGVGWATLRAVLRLWIGFPPARSGVFSAGNGPAMRIAPMGAFFAETPERMAPFLAATVRVTHSDPRAETGAAAVARATAWGIRNGPERPPDPAEFRGILGPSPVEDTEWPRIVDQLRTALRQNRSVSEFAAEIGQERGVSGYAYHTVPVAMFAWRRHYADFRSTVAECIACGGDADTVAAVAGAMGGAATGERGIPEEWIAGLLEWPRSVGVLRELADRLEAVGRSDDSAGAPRGPVPENWPGMAARNLVFLAIVLAHGFRRMFPPY